MKHRSVIRTIVTIIAVLCIFLGLASIVTVKAAEANISNNSLQDPWTVYNTSNSGLPHNVVRSTSFDQNGLQWFGTEGPAASFDGVNWQTYSNVQNAHSLAVDQNNNKWFGTYGDGLWKFDGTNWTLYTTGNSGLPSNNIRSIAVDPSGALWFGTGDCCSYANGLAHFDGVDWQTYTPANSCLPDRTVLAIAAESNGVVWLGTYGAGVVRFDGVNCIIYNSSNSPLPFNEVWDIALDSSNTPWIGTGAGLAHFDGQGWMVFTPSNSPLPGGAVVVEIDSFGNIWFGSESLVMYDGINFTIYNSINSPLPNNNVWELDFYIDGRLLIGTLNGGAVLNPGAIVPATITPTPSPTLTPPPDPGSGIVYDAFADFSAVSNPLPGSTWMYGYTWTLGGTFDLYRALRNDIDRPLSILWTRPENFITPNVNKNISGVDIINVDGCILHPPTVYLNLHLGQNNELSVLRWTAPENGTYIIDSAFKSLRFCSQPTTTDAHILYNSTPIFNVFINEYMSVGDHAFSTTLDLIAGDTIDFVVGVGQNGNYGADSTGVRATITKISGGTATPTPTPTSSPIPTPTAIAGGPYFGAEGSAITLSGANASTLDYIWSVDSPLCNFSNANDLTPNLTCSDNGTYTATLTANDGINPPVSSSAVVIVNNVSPSAGFDNNGPINEGDSATVSFSGISDPSPVDTLAGFHYAFDCNGGSLSEVNFEGSGASNSTSCAFADNGNYIVSGKVMDKDGGSIESTTTVNVNNVAPILGAVTIDQALIPVNTTINASASFTDPGSLDSHTALWNWDDGTTSSGSISPTNGNGTASASHSYSLPGVYLVKLAVTDKDGAPSNQSIYEFVVVYDPTAGFVTGSGSINSPAGAYLADPSATGQGKFGFNTKYKKNGALESETAFELEAGSFHFHSSNAQWLVISGARASFQGTGTVEGNNHQFGFTATLIDGQFTSGGIDMFRLRIWDMDNGNAVIYDNERGSYIYADPITPTSKGNIKVKK